MPQEVTRYIPSAVERELWVRAGGRCEFPSCNRLLYKSPVTFPAMPVACAVEFGRVRMPKADMPWIIYDHNAKRGAFTRALQVGDQHEQR